MTNLIGSRSRQVGPPLAVLAGAVLAALSGAAGGTLGARELRIPLMAPEEILTQDLSTAELTVLLDREIQTIREIRRPKSRDGALADEDAWQVVVYFDAPLATADGLRQAARWLGREADSLTRLGPTEIVLADPRPQTFLESGRDPLAVKDALRDIGIEALTTGELVWHRQRFSAMRNESSLTSRALRDEVELIERQRAGLLAWLAQRRTTGPRLLILVQNGFDLNPRDFYAEQPGASFLEDPRHGISQSTVSKALATEGWTVMCLALGPRPEEFVDPAAPLFEIARATGGAVINSRHDGSRRLERASTWPILVVELVAKPGAEALPLEVLTGSSNQKLQTMAWGSATPLPILEEMRSQVALAEDEPAPVLQLLRPHGLTFEGEVRFRTITGRHRIHRVVFLLDDAVVSETQKTPYSAIIDLGTGVRPHTVSAVAYSRSNRALGEDSLQLNTALEPPRVTITELSYAPDPGVLEISAEASAPSGAGPDSVEIFLNDHREVVLLEPPYRARLSTGELGPADIIRVLARYPSGETVEAARLPAAIGPTDELEVNLVELLAMVTPRNRKTTVELERGDFVVRQRGRPQPIDHFSHWEELQLTLGLVLDTSDSMDVILEDAREAGERFFQEALQAGDEAFVVDFNNHPRLTRRVTADSDQLLHSLDGLEARGMTALYDAIVFSLQQFDNASGRRALVVVTDGEDSASYYQPRECVRQARLHGVPVYLIVLGSPPDPHRDPELLRNLMVARRTGGEVYHISDLEDLSLIYDQIVGELRRQYSLGFDAGHTLTPDELEDIEIEVVQKGMTVRTLLASQQRGG